MKLAVNPNRMNNLRLRRRLVVAKRGHKLLKDKQDELMRQFMELIDTVKGERNRVEKRLISALKRFSIARSTLSREELYELFALPGVTTTLSVRQKQVLNLKIPSFELTLKGDIISYSFLRTTAEFDLALLELKELLEELVKLAEIEKKMQLFADEIDKTRRRVNALEYKLIPDIEETIKFITMKLEEVERGNLTRLMRVKDMLEEKRKE
ncbi:V-type ATP synthase subunit D [bacterium]|nr:V-type ATP synthase subunit D [bacterium]